MEQPLLNFLYRSPKILEKILRVAHFSNMEQSFLKLNVLKWNDPYLVKLSNMEQPLLELNVQKYLFQVLATF